MSEHTIADRFRELDELAPSNRFDELVDARMSQAARRRQQTRLAAAVTGVLVVMVGVFTLVGPGDDDESGIATKTVDAPLTWDELRAPPLSNRVDPLVVETDDGLFVWGGHSEASLRDGVRGDGAIYDIDDDTWTMLPDSPLGPRAATVGVWTGSEVLIWGGVAPSQAASPSGTVVVDPDETSPGRRDGAAFDPATNSWQPIPEAPITGRIESGALWTGTELWILGGQHTTGDGARTLGAAYDPATDSWRLLPDLGYANSTSSSAELLDDGSVLFWRQGDPDGPDVAPIEFHRINPQDDTWTPLPPLGDQPLGVVILGDQIVAAVQQVEDDKVALELHALDLGTRGAEWSITTTIDLDEDIAPSTLVHNTRELLLVSIVSGTTVVIDPVTSQTTTLEPPEQLLRPSSTLADRDLYLLGGTTLTRLGR